MQKLGWAEDMPIDHPRISKSLESAQRKVEARNFDLRKNVLEYDDVLNKQREIIYGQRRQLLAGEDVRDRVAQMMVRSWIAWWQPMPRIRAGRMNGIYRDYSMKAA